jgi:hypothetical protein
LRSTVILLSVRLADIIKTIKDPEEPGTLEELEMVNEDAVVVRSKLSGLQRVCRGCSVRVPSDKNHLGSY